jgi:hypothetical protein
MDFAVQIPLLALVTAILCAKWALDLGFSQGRQMIWFFAGLCLGPLAMLILYVQLVNAAPASARRWIQRSEEQGTNT